MGVFVHKVESEVKRECRGIKDMRGGFGKDWGISYRKGAGGSTYCLLCSSLGCQLRLAV